ncbi:polysaccharide pyruvyl transferase CsaB [Virgibacillus phasianinus]|uniref:Polysaccharide pyruvyl transferase CsaB n=1 Tax=Virgibacillus phasianinus TaxID=2017483 RepID=A0A220U234_9BACI|nr:polysaccharide pyruvyl transferase CsaB [Virgibacillus phasianinus]ASK62137.1 polysaccharide pyruvyl transferase CsaB [Virgibacillus phasianinus]
MHIVLSGYYGFDNVGDEAILYSIIQAMRKVERSVDITVLSHNPGSTMETYHVNAVSRWNFKEISRVMKKADGLVSGGGSLLQDQTGIKSIPYYTGIIKIAQWYQKPVFIYAQGMGPIRSRLNKWIVKRTLNNVDQITVRDSNSKNLLTDIGINKSTSIVPDPVIGLDSSKFTNSWVEQQQISNPIIAVSVRNWPTAIPYKEKMASCLDQLVCDGYEIVFVPMHGKYDERASKETAELMTEKSWIAPHDSSIEEKISIIGQSRVLIGMRLHSLIFSSITCTPFVAISYDPKIDAFASICEQTVAGHVKKDDWDDIMLLYHVNQALATGGEQQRIFEAKVKKNQLAALDTPRLALQLFSTGVPHVSGDIGVRVK